MQLPSPVEILASLTGLISVYLTVRNKIANWPWGIVSVLLFGWLFWSSRLYSDAGLQILYFLPMQFYGWWLWKKAGPQQNDDLPVTLLSPAGRAGGLAITVFLALGLGYIMSTHTNAALPYWDASLTAASIVAQYLDARKKLESWLIWIAVDLVSVFYLYPKQHLYVTTGLYALFLVLAVAGLIRWGKLARA